MSNIVKQMNWWRKWIDFVKIKISFKGKHWMASHTPWIGIEFKYIDWNEIELNWKFVCKYDVEFVFKKTQIWIKTPLHASLLALAIRKRLCICVGFGLEDKKFAHSFANVEMTSVHKMKFSNGCNFSCLGGCNPMYIRFLIIINVEKILFFFNESCLLQWCFYAFRFFCLLQVLPWCSFARIKFLIVKLFLVGGCCGCCGWLIWLHALVRMCERTVWLSL